MSVVRPSVRRMIIDCEGCTARPAACADCVVTFVLEVPARAAGDRPRERLRERPSDRAHERPPGVAGRDARVPFELDDAERRALGTLADLNLVPPLRLAEGG
ncbi:4Fe-4S ferredoxin-type domain-containing protein OS=Cellulomonas persica OX=76861 GN=CPE01_03800 PE=4 SV=1 [Cellulomonas persica]|uniref:Uncharacterized protein n=2 Tax=Cellulomonas persica TaxID=76861 RepID=A0A510UPQ4_9CELL|nr:hypothetical protein CPE01_03800 [Cellulomonas persica]